MKCEPPLTFEEFMRTPIPPKAFFLMVGLTIAIGVLAFIAGRKSKEQPQGTEHDEKGKTG